ncbi:hypothetical protein QBC33DRAFT_558418 [Phialemonium atrogriseum]|uniref:Uncharacterized protein n=1 Tax=Phialemonium atrogriseum TaxID=1093897 RepID=A0AAJ0C365_9PEZI|nr:uncharacterized protein QBC33DRAFT_558418 [Phialemonium atrogriseum]KAK1768258.1 hypothetical protein QBC33DRAFT_558418 [Phialemonium atrogriseum]
MKSLHLVAGLSIVAQVLAKQAPTLEVVARQMCSWEGHCRGDPCRTENDCDGYMTCAAGRCASTSAGGGPPATRSTRPPIFTIPTEPTTSARLSSGPSRSTSTRPPGIVPGRPTSTQPSTCEWTGHCIGDACKTENDCDADFICRAGRCASPDEEAPTQGFPLPTRTTTIPVPVPSDDCEWTDHCLGDPCAAHEDCDGDLACVDEHAATVRRIPLCSW